MEEDDEIRDMDACISNSDTSASFTVYKEGFFIDGGSPYILINSETLRFFIIL